MPDTEQPVLLDEPTRSLTAVRVIVLRALHGIPAQVFLFGSRARGDAGRASDIDVAIWPEIPLPPSLLSELREALEESTVPYRVDLVDLSTVEPGFREKVLREGIEWSDFENA